MKHFSYIFFDKVNQELICSNGYVPPRETAQYGSRIEKHNFGSVNVQIDTIAFPNVKNESNVTFTKRGTAVVVTYAGTDAPLANIIIFPRSESDLFDRVESILRSSMSMSEMIEQILKIIIEPLNMNTVILFMRNLCAVTLRDHLEKKETQDLMLAIREQSQYLTHDDDDSQTKFNIVNELPYSSPGGLTLHNQRYIESQRRR